LRHGNLEPENKVFLDNTPSDAKVHIKFMKQARLKEIIKTLKDVLVELESEVYSDPSKYLEGPNRMIGDDNDGEY